MYMNDERMDIRVQNGAEPNTKEVIVTFTVPSDQQMIDDAKLGKTAQTCKICGASGDFQTYRLLEMQHGTRDAFRYFECGGCGTLQIEAFPEDIGKYYPSDYYSYQQPPMQPPPPGAPRDTRMILDVGCGAGKWLCWLASIGCVNAVGCDPFIEKDVAYPNGVKLYKRSIHEMDGRYDVIALNNSFEHMPDPDDVFRSLARLLKKPGEQIGPEAPKIELTIPTHPSMTFDIYGPWAFPLDAPRHFFLYTDAAIDLLAERHGFYVESKNTVNNWSHLMASRFYQHGLTTAEGQAAINDGTFFKNPARTRQICDAMLACAALVNHGDLAGYVLKRRI